MTFAEQLQCYVEQIGMTYQELAAAAELSSATISRYCSGAREPKRDSVALRRLSAGIVALAAQRNLALSEKEILGALLATLGDGICIAYDDFLMNLQALLSGLDIRVGDLARSLNYDASHVSKILSGDRRPRYLKTFIEGIAAYIARHDVESGHIAVIAKTIGVTPRELSTPAKVNACIIAYLGSHTRTVREDPLSRFLTRIDEFDLSDSAVGGLHAVPPTPAVTQPVPERKEYIGIAQMMQSELDFMRLTLLSPSSEPCFLYSDMPMLEMAKDPDFSRAYIHGMIGLLQKGLTLCIIHDIHRPFAEMMLGLENYIPLYMTGQIAAYYLPKAQNDVFSHLLKVSGAAALEGIAVSGRQAEGKYVLYGQPEEVAHYRARADAVLKKARSLMDIYTAETRKAYLALVERVYEEGDSEMICSALPVYFLPDEALRKVLLCAEDDQAEAILSYAVPMRKRMEAFLQSNSLYLVLPAPNREAYDRSPVQLCLADLFINERVVLCYEDYLCCLQEVKALAAKCLNLNVEYASSLPFKNINITLLTDQMVIVSKQNRPAIHFAIHHPKMIRAFHNFFQHCTLCEEA